MGSTYILLRLRMVNSVAFSRAQNKTSIMCLLPPSEVVDGVPYTENIVYPPFIGAATGILSNKPSPSTP